MPPLARLALASLVLLASAACGSSRHLIAPGAQVAVVEELGLRAEVRELVNTRRRLEVLLDLENQGERELRFGREDVTLRVETRRYDARDVETWETDVDVAPGQVKSKVWGFHVGRVLKPGTYELTVAGVVPYVDGRPDGEARELVLSVTIPRFD